MTYGIEGQFLSYSCQNMIELCTVWLNVAADGTRDGKQA